MHADSYQCIVYIAVARRRNEQNVVLYVVSGLHSCKGYFFLEMEHLCSRFQQTISLDVYNIFVCQLLSSET